MVHSRPRRTSHSSYKGKPLSASITGTCAHISPLLIKKYHSHLSLSLIPASQLSSMFLPCLIALLSSISAKSLYLWPHRFCYYCRSRCFCYCYQCFFQISLLAVSTALGEPIGVARFGLGLLSLPAQIAMISPQLNNWFSYCLVSHSFNQFQVHRLSPLILGNYDDKERKDDLGIDGCLVGICYLWWCLIGVGGWWFRDGYGSWWVW